MSMEQEESLELAVVAYLKENPDFFQQHLSLLDELSVCHPKKGTLSLVEMQLKRQREKIRQLEQELAELTALAEYNASIFFSLMPLQQQLSQCSSLVEGNEALNSWAKSLGLQQAKILLLRDSWQSIATLAPQYWLDRKAFDIIRLERLGLRRFYLGLLSHKEKTLMFLPEEMPIGSVACCLLGQEGRQVSAIVLFTSADESHFNPKQDTLFLQHLTDLLKPHLWQWLKAYQK